MILNLFPAFVDFWQRARDLPVDAQVQAWASDYMALYPELLEKQIACYGEDGEDWRTVARGRVFPHLAERFEGMKIACAHLIEVCGEVEHAAREKLGLAEETLFVIYVGIGCGAGWATDYSGRPAVLFGVENIVECGWLERSRLRGLAAHELGHLLHAQWRSEAGLPADGSGPLWQLYSEGFAQRCEEILCGAESWHMQDGASGPDWAAWCRANCSYLAAEYLRRLDKNEPVRDFFGSWFEIQGYRQTGYFLGHALVRRLEERSSLQEIARIEPTAEKIISALTDLKIRVDRRPDRFSETCQV